MNQPLAETIFWIAVAASVIAQIAILRSTFASKRAEKSDLVPAAPRLGEAVWAFVPAIVLALVLVATWQRISARQEHMRMNHPHMQQAMLTATPARGQP